MLAACLLLTLSLYVYAEEGSKVGEQALDHESLLGSPITRDTPATSQPGVLPGVLLT